jgi:hypothetical protein
MIDSVPRFIILPVDAQHNFMVERYDSKISNTA